MIDVDFTKTLSKEMLVGGLFEAGKICYAKDYEAFLGYLAEVSDIQLSSLQRVILRALKTKKWFIEIDEFDQKERLLLNFGHTFGHALEAGTDYAITHGIAVGLGMMVAVEYANGQSWLSATGKEHASVLASHIKGMIGVGNGCIVKPPASIDLVRIMEKFENDKKHLAEAYRIVCPRHDGALELISMPKTDATRSGIAEAYRRALSNLAWESAN
jgi:3-dehydroquinate synthase